MTRTLFRLSSLLLGIALAAQVASGQVATGIPPFSSVTTSTFDTVDNANLNVHFSIPIFSKSGRGMPFSYVLSYDTSIWSPINSSGAGAWTPVPTWGWRGITEAQAGYNSYQSSQLRCRDLTTGLWDYYPMYWKWAYHDAGGVSHPFNIIVTPGLTACGVSPTNSGTNIATDGSGYTMTAYLSPLSATVYSRSGATIQVRIGSSPGAGSVTDANGNQSSASVSSNTTTFTDTLGATPLTVTAPGGGSNSTYTYTAPSGNGTYTVKYTSYTVQTNFGCSGVTEYGPTQQYLISEIDLPDQATNPNDKYTFTYEETTAGSTQYYTGRMAWVTLPTGGEISYGYGTVNHGINCADGTLTSLTRTTPDGMWTYTHSEAGSQWTTNITDPQNNQTVINFQGLYETQRTVNQGSSTVLETVNTCYNGASIPCTSTAITLPISSRTVQVTLPGLSPSQTTTTYNATYGVPTETDEYTYGPTLARKTLISYATLTNIYDRPGTVLVYDGGGNLKAKTVNTYDASGNLKTATYTTQGSSTLQRGFSYNANGTLATATDVNNNVATYTYASGSSSCNGAFPTSVQLSNTISPTLSRSMTWDCNGGVMLSLTDENTNVSSYSYNDYTNPFWRLTSTTDPTTAKTSISYSANPFAIESTLNFNSSTSTADTRTTLDGLGRIQITQREQGQGAANYDSVETGYDSLGRPSSVSVPYSAAAGGTYSGSTFTTTTYDALNRPTLVTDGGGGTVGYTYTENDVLVAVGPAPTGENTKRRQLEYDALGRLTSVCEVTSASGSGNCAQSSPQTGYWTQYTYDALGDLAGVTQNAQGSPTQSRTYNYDMLGRLTSEINPESGTTTYVYDTDSTCGTHSGDMVKRVDAVGNVTCYAHDALHRLTGVTYPSGSYAGVTPSKTFVYDSATVNGSAMANAKGRLAEAYTGSSKTTDLGFSYSARGEVADVLESTPHSGGYYSVGAAYWANGLLHVLSGAGLPNLTYGPDGEGRVNTVGASAGQNPVSSTSYNVYSLPMGVTLGSGDSDAFGYDLNTGRMTSYQFTVNSQSVVGNTPWNANGTLKQLAITDPFNSSNQQTCNATYDDLARLKTFDCAPNWNQSFADDPFGNLSKTGLGGGALSFQPSYSNNRVSSLGSYDANGNLTSDGVQSYAWDSDGNSVSIAGIGLTFDALDRMVEQNRSGSYTQIVYGPSGGKLALMNGQTLVKGFAPLSAGDTAVYTNGPTLSYYRHADWLGSSRFASTPSRAMYYDGAYAPYGENYAETGTTDRNFTGQNQDTISSGSYPLYDFLYREHHPVWGRWLSPDPAGLGAVDPTNPQSWNRYAYVSNNPLLLIDPSGMDACAQAADPRVCRAESYWGLGNSINPYVNPLLSDEFSFLNVTLASTDWSYQPIEPISTPIDSINNEWGVATSAIIYAGMGWAFATLGNGFVILGGPLGGNYSPFPPPLTIGPENPVTIGPLVPPAQGMPLTPVQVAGCAANPELYPDKSSNGNSGEPLHLPEGQSSVYYTPGWSKTQPAMNAAPLQNPEAAGPVVGLSGGFLLLNNAAVCRDQKTN